MYFLSTVASLVVRNSAVNCLENLISEILYYASTGTLNFAQSLNTLLRYIVVAN